jgi:ribosomal protein L11 methyltransferase
MRVAEQELIIAAGEAFGSGAHPSTALVLEALHGVAASGIPITQVLDVGAGSGILSIATAQLFAEASILATDISPHSAAFVAHNAAVNGVEGRIDALRAQGVMHPTIHARAPYDLVLCNLSTALILPLLRPLYPLTHANSLLIFSGIQMPEDNTLAEAMHHAGFHVRTMLAQTPWCAMVAGHVPKSVSQSLS